SVETVVEGLNLGAADYIAKPVAAAELEARIRNKVFSFQRLAEERLVRFDDLTVDFVNHRALIKRKRLPLTPIEYRLLKLFVRNPNQLFSRQDIIDHLWPQAKVKNQNIDTHLSNLRRKLGPYAENLKTMKSRGYIL